MLGPIYHPSSQPKIDDFHSGKPLYHEKKSLKGSGILLLLGINLCQTWIHVRWCSGHFVIIPLFCAGWMATIRFLSWQVAILLRRRLLAKNMRDFHRNLYKIESPPKTFKAKGRPKSFLTAVKTRQFSSFKLLNGSQLKFFPLKKWTKSLDYMAIKGACLMLVPQVPLLWCFVSFSPFAIRLCLWPCFSSIHY